MTHSRIVACAAGLCQSMPNAPSSRRHTLLLAMGPAQGTPPPRETDYHRKYPKPPPIPGHGLGWPGTFLISFGPTNAHVRCCLTIFAGTIPIGSAISSGTHTKSADRCGHQARPPGAWQLLMHGPGSWGGHTRKAAETGRQKNDRGHCFVK